MTIAFTLTPPFFLLTSESNRRCGMRDSHRFAQQLMVAVDASDCIRCGKWLLNAYFQIAPPMFPTMQRIFPRYFEFA